jgi:hypothetical protein
MLQLSGRINVEKYEVLSDVVDDIANWIGIYGIGDDDGLADYPTHSDKCNCRICFTTNLEQRIRDAVSREKKMPFINELRYGPLADKYNNGY